MFPVYLILNSTPSGSQKYSYFTPAAFHAGSVPHHPPIIGTNHAP